MSNRSHSNQSAARSERFMRLLMPVYKRLEDFAFAMARDPEEACDLVAETLFRAFESLDRLQDEKAFLAYLFTIASRELHRDRRRARRFGAFNQEEAERIAYRGTPPDISADVQHLYEALARLPDKQREAVVLFEISGFSMNEIREIQGGSLSSIKVRIFRARRRLAELLGASDATGTTRPSGPVPGESGDAAGDCYNISFEANLNR